MKKAGVIRPSGAATHKQTAVAAQPVQKFILEVETTIKMIKNNGEKIEKKIPYRIKNYKDLQREICVITKDSKNLYSILDEKNLPIYASQFKTYDVIKVKEVAIKPSSYLLRGVASTWDRDEYGKMPIPQQIDMKGASSATNASKSKKKDDDDWD
eukprot:gene33679-43528_t